MMATKSATPIAMAAWRIMLTTPEPVANEEGGNDAAATPIKVGKVRPTPTPVQSIPPGLTKQNFIVAFIKRGFNQITAKYALTEIPPLTQAALRSAFAALVVGTFALLRQPRLIAADGTLASGLLCGLLFGVEFIVLFLGLQWTTASHAILFLYSAPLFVSLGLLVVAPDERLSRLQWLGLLLSFCGVAVALGVASVSRLQLIGDALSLLAGALWAGTTLVVMRRTEDGIEESELSWLDAGEEGVWIDGGPTTDLALYQAIPLLLAFEDR